MYGANTCRGKLRDDLLNRRSNNGVLELNEGEKTVQFTPAHNNNPIDSSGGVLFFPLLF